MSGYLYIARIQDGTGRLKVGHCRDPLARRPRLSGQTEVSFELLQLFPTALHAEAEPYAHSLLECQGGRPPGNRKELFSVSEEAAVQACLKAVEIVPKLFPLPRRKSQPGAVRLTHPAGGWRALLAFPVTFAGEKLLLADLMGIALRDQSAIRQLRRMGIVCVKWCEQSPEFQADLEPDSRLYQWCVAAQLQEFVQAEPCQATFSVVN